ncbi:MAG: ferritin-like fold-containing protein [Microbacteriaceae bacterium]
MVNWFWRTGARKRNDVPRLRPRGDSDATTKVDLADLTPEPLVFLGRAAYLQLMIFENLSTAVVSAPNAEAKDTLGRVAALALTRQRGLTAEIERRGAEPGATMQPFTAEIDAFQRATQGADWFEMLVTCQVTAGFLGDFFVRLASGLPNEMLARVRPVLAADSGSELLAQQIRDAIEAEPLLASRLAMWGRRLVGDTMLVARGSVAASANHVSDDSRIEPVFTELIAAHTRRMDALGLTA